MKSESRIRQMLIASAATLALALPAAAQDESKRHPVDKAVEIDAPKAMDGPVVPADAGGWAGSMLIVVVAMFVMAAMIGPIVRAEMPAEEPVPHDDHGRDAHDSHGHGDHGH